MIRSLLESFNKKGIKRTMIFILSYAFDVYFDIKHGVETVSWVKLQDLKIDSHNKKRGVDYQPTQVYSFRKIMKELMIPSGKTFYDLGCGKGRILMLSSEFGCKKARGIEFSAELCKIARKNCSIYKVKTGKKTKFDIIESDVASYSFEDGDLYFMFNPFDGYVLSRVLQSINQSLLLRKRKIWIIYRNPVHGEIFAKDLTYRKIMDTCIHGSDYSVYTNVPS